eukprot:TRINITY_DN94347_c0_g1_i1.p1 TRINITY_DN94347_c0_g1~~TRINITY_DN94347_c0_g1_i1.p1  ORF type:complete len:349 (+),score=20.85 TRINITY_DN94347_c0_g1_i1:77-1123(+)
MSDNNNNDNVNIDTINLDPINVNKDEENEEDNQPIVKDVPVSRVIVHPLVLLSAVDHYNREAKDTKKRVVGALLGSKKGNLVDITNSFAIPFEEDLKNPTVWFLDHNFLETMYRMFRKVNNGEEIVGFYSSGPKIKENDLNIAALFKRFSEIPPVFVIIDVRPNVQGLPTSAYEVVEEVEIEGKEIQKVFKHLPSSIEAEEAEGVGVEHLIRDINDPSTSSLALQIHQKISSLSSLVLKLNEIKNYLNNVLNEKLPINNQILYNLQDIMNLLPNLNVDELVKSMMIKSNDMYLLMYISSLVRSVIALHELLSNKIKYKDLDDILDKSIVGNNKEKEKTNNENNEKMQE